MKRMNLISVLLLLAGFQVYAQPELREVVTVNADLEPIGFEELTRTVTVLDRARIEQIPASSVYDLLRYVAGVEVKSRSPFGVQNDISVRGSGFGRILILVDGVRMNDSQTGHHSADLPVALADIERIEVLGGAGSSVHGADALGGTINIITRGEKPAARAALSTGQHGLVEGFAGADFGKGMIRQSLSIWGNRSSGFMYDRDFRTFGIRSSTSLGKNTTFSFSHVDKDFGANQFYGDAPSRERTSSTLAVFDNKTSGPGGTVVSTRTYYRTHGDRFVWDLRQPEIFENRHRTHTAGTRLAVTRGLSESSSLVLGSELGGEWIRSGSLGDHRFFRSGLFAQLRVATTGDASLTAGLRWDYTTAFSGSLSPSVSYGRWIHPSLRLRASAGHAFRIPTFTELYYQDPNHQAGTSLEPERSWETEGGLDWFPASSWLLRGGVYCRWEDDVIDWVRGSPEEKWRTMNIRDIQARGAEILLEKQLREGMILQLQYGYLDLRADDFRLLSKYVFDYPRHSLSGFSSFTLPLSFNLSQRIAYMKREDGRGYWLADLRLGRDFERFGWFGEVTNLLNTGYQEIRGVDMPGRWFRAGITFKGF